MDELKCDIQTEDSIAYLILIIDNYLDRYGSEAKNHKEFIKTIKRYQQLIDRLEDTDLLCR